MSTPATLHFLNSVHLLIVGSLAAEYGVRAPEDLLVFCLKGEGDGRFHCAICHAFSHPGRHQVRNHIESRHFASAFQYTCPHCSKTLKSRKALEVHVSEKHRVPKF
jgi:hypothetical protein